MSKLKKWNDAYKDADFLNATPASVLSENQHLLPNEGRALDLACGRAGNALFLAKLENKNFKIDAIDFSPVVINSLKQFVANNALQITPILRDIESNGISDDNDQKYDVIVVSYFLDRKLFPNIINELKPNGLLFYQTWSQESVDSSGPSNSNFRLKAGELLQHCSNLKILSYKEEGGFGDINKGFRNEAMIVASYLTK